MMALVRRIELSLMNESIRTWTFSSRSFSSIFVCSISFEPTKSTIFTRWRSSM